MHRITWALLLLFAFTIPWEYSLDLGEPLGNAARIAGVLALLAAVPAILQAGRMRHPSVFGWIALALYLWFCVACFWSIDLMASLIKLRAYFQEFMIVWLLWEFAETPGDLRNLLRAAVAGSWVLAVLTLVVFRSPEAMAAGQIRFAASGQDPNDMARYLDLGFPLAALLARCEGRWPMRVLSFGFLPVGLLAVLLTASRSGFLAALVALGGSLALLALGQRRRMAAAAFALPILLAALWFIVPGATLQRLATIPQQLASGNFNERVNIWTMGWDAFARAPLAGSGAGSFVAAARTASFDTAHNTALMILVEGGLCALFLVTLLAALAIRAARHTRGPLRLALTTCLLVLAVGSLTATIEENRMTWLLLATTIVAARLSMDDPQGMDVCFGFAPPQPASNPQNASAGLAEV